ncbi:MAG TPA: DUF2071 domain-containing protein [Gemmatimonadaceae bacterium]|nr:DUF2071 domain-containing protein [Gemmatimonadaceae bacterium]
MFLTAEWRYLALLNFEVDPAVLTPLLPRGTELDNSSGRHFISLVGFLFLDTRVLGVPAFLHRDFEEINLRFYVRRSVAGEARRGVVFIREMVSLPLVAAAARLTYNEPYRTVPIRHRIAKTKGGLQTVEYRFGGPGDECRFALHVDGEPHPIVAGSDEEFLSERPWGYTTQRDSGTIEYHVEHPRWSTWSNAGCEIDGPLGDFYDEPFSSILSVAPASAFIADGSAVAVHLPERIA